MSEPPTNSPFTVVGSTTAMVSFGMRGGHEQGRKKEGCRKRG